MVAGKTEKTLSVSAAIRCAKQQLDALPLCIEGEVSQVSNKPGYKAVYFTIKDKSAALPCMMWVNRYAQAGVDLKVGALVRVTGKLSIYAAKGTMNFEVSSLVLAGEGDLRQKIAQLAEKLTREGLTSLQRKRPLPDLPEVIGLVTSPRGAAVHDVLRTLRRRYPFARVVFAGVPVEGVDAARNVAYGMKAVVDAGAQLVLVVRGGGSFEDLMPFNDEYLARTIAACPVPVVTGIGHEPDTTIADLVADLRCSTPTAAAEAVSPEDGALVAFLAQAAAKMNAQLARLMHLEQLRLNAKATRPLFKDAQSLLSQEYMGLDFYADRLSRALPSGLAHDKERLRVCSSRLLLRSRDVFAAQCGAVGSLAQRIRSSAQSGLEKKENLMALAAAKMDTLSPLAVLSRGYSIAFDEKGSVVNDVYAVQAGESLSLRVKNGTLSCKVEAQYALEKEQ